jgi:hypothetical protein
MPEKILRKLDSATLKFFKLQEGKMEVVGNVGDDADPKVRLRQDEVLEVRTQDNQIAIVRKDRGSVAGSEEEKRALFMLSMSMALGGRKEGEQLDTYLARVLDVAISASDYGVRPDRQAPMIRQTHTYVTMELSVPAYEEIAEKMRAAEYDHAFGREGEIDMHGIAVTKLEIAG